MSPWRSYDVKLLAAETGALALILTLAVWSSAARSQDSEEIYFSTADGGTIYGDVYGAGPYAVLLAHGAVFNKESWRALARRLAGEGFRSLAIDFRGYGKSKPGTAGDGALDQDVIAGIRYLRANGAQGLTLIGASMGGGAVAQATTQIDIAQTDHVILLAAVPIVDPERIQGDKLFLVSAGDPLRDTVEEQFNRAREPKQLKILAGGAHAQHIFKSREQGEELTETIVAWLVR